MTVRALLPDDPRQVGPWELHGRLGSGGFGTVYDGVGPGGHRGAVKTMHRYLAEQPEFLARFGREITLAKRVRGEHVARVLDYDLRGDPPFLVTEFVEGPTLHDAVERNGPLEGDNLYALALALAEAISQVADAGVIHRDLKPANLILTERAPVLVDFGIASAAGLERLTSTGMVFGTGPYMAPEQFTGAQVDHRIDVFAWASVVTFAANGRPPFTGEDGGPSAVMYRVLHGEPDHGALTGPLRALVAEAHAKDPADRPAIDDVVHRLVAQRVPDTEEEAGVDHPTELVEQTWHLPTALAGAAAGPATEVQPEPAPTAVRPEPVAPPDSVPRVVYTPPAAEPVRPPPPAPAPRPAYGPPPAGQPYVGQPQPQQPPYAPAPGEAVRYRGDRLAEWVAKLPNFGKLGILSAGLYIGFGVHFDDVNDGVPITSVNQADLDEAFDAAWAFLPLVAFLVLAYVALRVVRAVGRRRGFTTAQWRGFAATSAAVGIGLALLPALATVVLAYGPGVLEPNDRITQEVLVASAIAAAVMGVLAVVGLVYAVRAVINVFRALMGTVTW